MPFIEHLDLAVDLTPEPMRETIARTSEWGGEITTHLCNVTDSAQVAAMVRKCIDTYGRIDVLVNNVGGSARGGPVEYDGKDIRVNSIVPGQSHTPMVEPAWPTSVSAAMSTRC